ncbi:MAG: sugar ABC transporter ATP-binding protein [Devosia sp.]
MTSAYLKLDNISKAFVGTRVLSDVSFDVRPGEVHALMGENGAGKSTLIKIISGLLRPDGGTISIGGDTVRFAATGDASAAGIATVYQELLLFPEFTVAENVFVGHYPRTRWGAIDWKEVRRSARKLLDSLDLSDLDVDTKVGRLSVAQRQRVEIAKGLSRNAKILILDEPTASLTQADANRLMDVVRRLKQNGVGIIYVSHRLAEVFALSDRITVLRDGQFVATLDTRDVDEPKLVSLMVGRPLESIFPKVHVDLGETALEVRNLSCGPLVRDVSFSVRRGEILGVAGLVGSGRTEMALALFGMTPSSQGEIILEGKSLRIGSSRQARDLGIAYVPEDRGLQGLVKPMPIKDNVTLATLSAVTRGGFLDFREEAARANRAIERFGIRCRGGAQVVGELSGGNQQKVVIAKWLEIRPKVLILDEPTRGVDVGAKSEIHAIIGELAKQGVAIVMISSELPEVLGMSDRIMVMASGRVSQIIDREQATAETVGAAMTAHRSMEMQ